MIEKALALAGAFCLRDASLILDANVVEGGQEDGADFGDEVPGFDGGIFCGQGLRLVEIFRLHDDDPGHVVAGILHVAQGGPGEEEFSCFGLPSQKGELLGHEVFVALRPIPLRALAQKAEEVGLEVAGHVGCAGSLGVFGHASIVSGVSSASAIAGINVAAVVVLEAVAGEAGYAEVSAEMQEVERAEGSVDDDEVDVLRIGDE